MAAPRFSVLTNGETLRLPPMVPDPATDTDGPVVLYSLKLGDDMVDSIANGDTTIMFKDPANGVMTVGGEQFQFTTRAGDDPSEKDKAFAFSLSGNEVRTLGPIVGELDIERKMSERVSSQTKKRTIDATNAGKSREVKLMDDNQVSAPKRRRGVQPEKRQRAAPPMSRPRPSSSLASMGRSNGHSQPQQLSRLGASSNISPYASPHVSPGSLPNGSYMNNGSLRGAPVHTLSGLPPKNTPPPTTSVPAAKPLPLQYTPTKPGHTRSSPNASRGPSPGAVSSAPSSPKVGNLRPKSVDNTELRRNVIHILALGEASSRSVLSRLTAGGTSKENMSNVSSIIGEVGRFGTTGYVLRDHFWSEVSDTYPKYSDMERSKMKIARSQHKEDMQRKGLDSGGKSAANGSDALNVSSVSTDAQLDAAIAQFSASYEAKLVSRIGSAAEDAEVRRQFSSLYPLYTELARRLEMMSNTFSELGERYEEARAGEEKDALERRIAMQYEKRKDEHAKYVKVLSKLHDRLRSMQSRVDQWAGGGDE